MTNTYYQYIGSSVTTARSNDKKTKMSCMYNNHINTWSELMLQENLTILLANEFINLNNCKIKYELIEFHNLNSRIIK